MNAARKVVSVAEAATRARAEQGRGRVVVMCHGCFDIVHPGHLRHLTWARQQGDVLIVSISADSVIDKGVGRPLVPEALRAENLAALECVDMVVVTPTPTAVETIHAIRPDRYVKGAEYRDLHDPRISAERDAVRAGGGHVLFSAGDVVYSSTQLIGAHAGEWRMQRERIRGYAQRHHLRADSMRKLMRMSANLRCLVVGDSILDEYIHCDPTHVAGESPMLNATLVGRERFMGGGAIIAQHLRALGAGVALATPVGRGEGAEALRDTCAQSDIRLIPLEHEGALPIKQRFLAKGVKVLKLDDPPPPAFPAHATDDFVRAVDAAAPARDLVVLVDFGYGALAQDTLPRVLNTLRPRARTLLGDVSGPRANLLALRQCDLVLPNEDELRVALRNPTDGVATLAGALASKTASRAVMVKLGEDGLVAFDATRRDPQNRLLNDFLPAFSDRAADTLGCGDALLSAAGLALAGGGSLFDAAFVGSIAAAIEAETRGNRPILLEPLLTRMDAAFEALGPLSEPTREQTHAVA